VPVWQLRVPESARRQFEAARTKLQENNCAGALNHLRKAIQSYADYGDAHTALGECYAQMDQFDAAEQEIKHALEQPHRPELHLFLGKIYAREGNPSLQARQLHLYEEEKPPQQSNRQ
jgi:Flp pilus assembly protein TadD